MVLAGAMWLTGCAPPGAPPADAAVLMEADRAFNDDVSRGGSAAWAQWFAEDGAVIREGTGEIRGREAIRQASTALDRTDVSLSWEPERVEISASGDLGWTTGSYVSVGPGADGEPVERTGRYVSIWRKQPDGSWRVVMDLGNPTGPEPGG